MFDLRDDGTIGIDFTVPNEEGEPAVKTVVVRAPGTIGALKRIRAELSRITAEEQAYIKELREDENVTVAQFATMQQDRIEADVVTFWHWVLLGDESWKGLAADAPADSDEWPPYLSTNESVQHALMHWKTVPLGRGGTPVTRTT